MSGGDDEIDLVEQEFMGLDIMLGQIRDEFVSVVDDPLGPSLQLPTKLRKYFDPNTIKQSGVGPLPPHA
jgi:hypothetical protein